MPNYKSSFLGLMLLGCVFSPLAQATGTPHWVHYRLLQDESSLPKKVVVLPVKIEVIEVTAGDVEEEVPAWSSEASSSVLKAISAAIKEDSTLTEVKLPKLSKKSSENVDEHIALYKLVVNTASNISWQHKVRRFDYGIGPGLDELRKQTGADAAVMVFGQDYASTSGRKAKAIVSRIPLIGILAGAPADFGHSYIHIGVVDLKTGDLLWMNSEYREGSSNLREEADAQAIVKAIFEWYPAIEKYRDAYVR